MATASRHHFACVWLDALQLIHLNAIQMEHSTVTSRGQTTIPREIRKALNLRGGERLTYDLREDGVLLRLHPGTTASYGSLPVAKDKRNVPIAKARKQAMPRHARMREEKATR